MSYQVRCVNCGKVRIITSKDVKDTIHTPKSKAIMLQKRTAHKCEKCSETRYGICEV